MLPSHLQYHGEDSTACGSPDLSPVTAISNLTRALLLTASMIIQSQLKAGSISRSAISNLEQATLVWVQFQHNVRTDQC